MVVDETDAAATRLSVTRSTLVVVAGLLSTSIGVIPYLLWVQRWWVLWAGVGVVLVGNVIGVLDYEAERPEARASLTYLAVWSAVAFGAMLSALSLLVCFAVTWLWRGAGWLAGRMGGDLAGDAATIAFWVSVACFLGLGFVMGAAASLEIAERVFPSTAAEPADDPTAQSVLPRTRTVLATVAVALVLLAVLLLLTEPGSAWRVGLLACWMVVFTVPLLADEEEDGLEELRARERITSLLEALGYSVITDPRSGEAELDALFAELDLLATRGDHGLAIEIKWRRQAEPVEWFEASHLRTAAWAVRQWKAEEWGETPVEPVLLLVDCDVAESFEAFLRDEPFTVLRLSSDSLEAVDAVDGAELAELAAELLPLRVDAAPAPAPGKDVSV